MINNTVIKVLNPEHGKRVAEWFESQGVKDIPLIIPYLCEFNYWGVIEGAYDRFRESYVLKKGLSVIELPEIKENYDFINPSHYKKFSVETIDMMVAVWGKESTALHCEMCAFKYRLRMGEKPDQPIERDLEKVNWYLNKAAELRK